MNYRILTRNFILVSSASFFLLSCKSDAGYESSVSSSDSLMVDSNSFIEIAQDESFKKTLNIGEMNLDINSQGEDELKSLKLSLKSGEKSISPEKGIKYDGIIQDALTADLNNDGKSEVYVFNQSAGSGSYGQLFAFQINGSKLDSITMEELPDDLSMQYLGHDSFALEKDHILRFFPLYNEMDANCCPSGGVKKLKYQLVKKAKGLKLVISD